MNEDMELRMLESDLRDSRNPKILEKYPHLGSQINISRLESRIAELKTRMSQVRDGE